jgi:hypothetical protein
MLWPRVMKIRQARDRLSNRGDHSSPIKSRMWPAMERRKMILAQALYLWRNRGNIEGRSRRPSHTGLPSLLFLSLACLPSRLFRAPPPLNAEPQIGDEHSQDNQPKSERFDHGVPGPNKLWAKSWVALIRKAMRSLSSS